MPSGELGFHAYEALSPEIHAISLYCHDLAGIAPIPIQQLVASPVLCVSNCLLTLCRLRKSMYTFGNV
jgi:hypothetical protein